MVFLPQKVTKLTHHTLPLVFAEFSGKTGYNAIS